MSVSLVDVEFKTDENVQYGDTVFHAEAFDADGERVESIIHTTKDGAVEDVKACAYDAERYVVTEQRIYTGASE